MTKEDVLSYFTLIDGKLKCNLCKNPNKVRLTTSYVCQNVLHIQTEKLKIIILKTIFKN